MKYQKNDIVQTKDSFGANEFVVLEVGQGWYLCKKNNKKYKIREDQIADKVGETLPVVKKQIDQEDFCVEQGKKFPQEKDKWEFLACCEPGQKLKLIHRNYLCDAEFIAVNFSKPIRPIRAKMLGKVYDFAFNSLDLDVQ